MAIAINGSGTVTGISVGGLPDGIVDTDMIAAGAVTAAKRGAGAILQVVNTNITATSSLSVPNGDFIDTPLTVNITSTAANSKFIVTGYLTGEANNGDHVLGIVLRRVIGGSTSSINVGDTAGSRPSLTAIHQQGMYQSDNASTPSCNNFAPYVDSPNQSAGTTITYKFALWGMGYTMTYYVGRSVNDVDNAYSERLPNYITVMEVAA